MEGYLSAKRLRTRINPKHGDLLLFVCCYVTGMIDCAAFNNYQAFAGMQTGNTVILFLSTTGYPVGHPYAWAITLVSTASFFVGCFITARVSNALGPLRRYVMTGQFVVQGLLCFLPAILTLLDVVPTDPNYLNPNLAFDPRIIGALPPLAFQSGSTMATSRILGFSGEIPVNVITSTYAALATDMKLFAKKNAPRNRRVVAVLCVMTGALTSAWIQKSGVGVHVVFWICGALKCFLAVVVYIIFTAQEPAAS